MSVAGDLSRTGWLGLPGRSWLFNGKRFADERGTTCETFDSTNPPSDALGEFRLTEENLVHSEKAGCGRGLHYQHGAFAQAKFVTLLRGSAQLLWLPLEQTSVVANVHSAILSAPGQSIYTPSDCAHGVLTLADDTLFLLKASSPTVLAERGEINLLSDRLSVSLARPIRVDLQSERDRHAPHWSPRTTTDS